jgi:hypothetical protein
MGPLCPTTDLVADECLQCGRDLPEGGVTIDLKPTVAPHSRPMNPPLAGLLVNELITYRQKSCLDVGQEVSRTSSRVWAAHPLRRLGDPLIEEQSPEHSVLRVDEWLGMALQERVDVVVDLDPIQGALQDFDIWQFSSPELAALARKQDS